MSDAMFAKNIVILQSTVYSSPNPRELEVISNTVELLQQYDLKAKFLSFKIIEE